MAELSIHSQINTTSSGLTTSSGWVTAGFSPNGWFADGIGAMRFAFPEDFSGSETIYSATLNINASAVGGSGSWCKTWVGIIAGAQTLPADYMGLSSASTRSPQRILGGYTSDGVDYRVDGTKSLVAVDLTAAFLAAQSDGALSSGYVVILYYPHTNNGGAAHQIDGIGSDVPAALTFDYAEGGPIVEVPNPYRNRLLADHTLTPSGLHPPRNLLL